MSFDIDDLDIDEIMATVQTKRRKPSPAKKAKQDRKRKKQPSKSKSKPHTENYFDFDFDFSDPANEDPTSFLDVDSAYTGRGWAGEHLNLKTQQWELKKGHWWNPLHKAIPFKDLDDNPRVKYEGAWEKGAFPLEDRYFLWFYEFFFDPTKYAIPVYPGVIHREWGRGIENGQKIMYLCPRDHFKTTFLNVGYALYNICEKPQISQMGILMIAWDDELIGEIFTEIKENLEQNRKILSYYGMIVDQNRSKTQKKIYFVYSPSGARYGIKCTTFKSGSITGGHPALVFADDIEDEPLSPKLMKKFKRVFLNKLIPALGKFGRMIVTGTIKGYNKKNDCYLILKDNPFWISYIYPAANRIPTMKEVQWSFSKKPAHDPVTGKVIINVRTGKQKLDLKIEVQIQDREQYTTIFPERYTIEDIVIKRLEMMFFSEDKDDDAFWSEYQLVAKNPKGRRFDWKRIKFLPPQNFINLEDFKEHLKREHIARYVWIDPGGKNAHGMAMALISQDISQESIRYYILDLRVVRQGIYAVVKQLAEWILHWNVTAWGAEGNFDQKERVGQIAERLLYEELKGRAKEDKMVNCTSANNTGNKILRIDVHFNAMIGALDMPIQLFINKNAQDLEQFRDEVKNFPRLPEDKSHEFDLMDAVTSAKIHLFGLSAEFFWEGGESNNMLLAWQE